MEEDLLAAPQVVVDLLCVNGKSGRDAVENDRKTGSVGLPGGKIAQHALILLYSLHESQKRETPVRYQERPKTYRP